MLNGARLGLGGGGGVDREEIGRGLLGGGDAGDQVVRPGDGFVDGGKDASFLCCPTLISVCDYWKKYSKEYCQIALQTGIPTYVPPKEEFPLVYGNIWTSLVAQTVKRLPTVWETRVRSLGWEDLEKEMATHSSILAWKIPWTEEPGRLQSMGLQRVRHD